jgi:uncharacterized protein with HEPN domain
MSRKKPARHREPDESEWITSFHNALAVVEDHILPLSDEEFLESDLLQRAAFGAFEEIRTAAQHLSRATLGAMPEVPAGDIADVRNLALYEYPTHKATLLLRTLRNQAASWRSGIDRVRSETRDGQPLAPLPSRTDGTLQKLRDRQQPVCGKPVKSAGAAPCVLKRGHGGNCRSR